MVKDRFLRLCDIPTRPLQWHPTVEAVVGYMKANDIPMTATLTFDELDGVLLEWEVAA